jgi:hypothetical protein
MRPSNDSHDHTGPAIRATTDSILKRLNEESPYASMLHEEIPDWLVIERRPTPRPAPRPVPKPKETPAVIPVTITENPKPKRGKPHPKTDLEEPARAEVAAALKRVGRGPCSVSAELFRHTGMSNWLKTGKGLGAHNVAIALDWARNVMPMLDEPEGKPKPRRQVISHFANGEAVYEWTTEPEASAFDPQPSLSAARDEIKAAPVPEPDPAAHVLETWAASKLTYAMETLGLTMPEGYRFRVTVERVAAV